MEKAENMGPLGVLIVWRWGCMCGRKKLCSWNRPSSSDPFNKILFCSEEVFSDVGAWVGQLGLASPAPQPPWGPEMLGARPPIWGGGGL